MTIGSLRKYTYTISRDTVEIIVYEKLIISREKFSANSFRRCIYGLGCTSRRPVAPLLSSTLRYLIYTLIGATIIIKLHIGSVYLLVV